MKSLLRNKALSILGYNKKIDSGIHILNSHYISRDNIDSIVFHDLLTNLKRNADLINIEEAIELINKKKRLNERLIAFTFDDGFEECYTKIAPVLKDFNCNAALFINPGYIDGNDEYIYNFNKNVVHVNKNPMNWGQIRELHNMGFMIGNHTYDHKRLVGLEKQEIEHQIITSKNKIEKEVNTKCDYFAWTYGGMKDIDLIALNCALENHNYVFSSDNYTKYYSNNNPRIINRRHIEGDWPLSHVKYFLSKGKNY